MIESLLLVSDEEDREAEKLLIHKKCPLQDFPAEFQQVRVQLELAEPV